MYQYSLGLYEKAIPDHVSLEDKLLIARDTGYDYLELCVDLAPERAARLDWSADRRQQLVRFLQEHNLHLTTLSMSVLRRCPLGQSEESAAEFLATLEKGISLACDLGAQIILFNGYDAYDCPSTPETQARFARYLPQVAALAAKRGVVLGIENAEKEFMDSITKAANCIEQVQSPYLCIYGDIANTANAMNGDVDAAMADIARGRGRLAAMHLKDSSPGEYRFTPYGEGHVDFPRSVALCKELGVRVFTAELFYREGMDYLAEARRVNHFLRGFF